MPGTQTVSFYSISAWLKSYRSVIWWCETSHLTSTTVLLSRNLYCIWLSNLQLQLQLSRVTGQKDVKAAAVERLIRSKDITFCMIFLAQQQKSKQKKHSSNIFFLHCSEPNVAWKGNKRREMQDRGLYNKHSRDHKLIRDYARYLHIDRQVENYTQDVRASFNTLIVKFCGLSFGTSKQFSVEPIQDIKCVISFQVDNVARYLYYMDPKEPSLHFVLNKEKTQQYLRDLTEAGLMKQTQINYLKNLKWLVCIYIYAGVFLNLWQCHCFLWIIQKHVVI